MSSKVIFVSLPGLRKCDLKRLPRTQSLLPGFQTSQINHHFPSVTWSAQAHMLTGVTASQHGVIGNGFFWRDPPKVEMWTARNDVIMRPQIWDRLKSEAPHLTSAAWFPMLAKACNANYAAMPAPIHNPDGSEDLWCYTKPQDFYGELLKSFGHFPLQHFWGPLANIKSSKWIVDSGLACVRAFHPDFFYLYLPHLDYAAQKFGPDDERAGIALDELDTVLSEWISGCQLAQPGDSLKWILASEYVIQPVDHVCFPNRILREAGLLRLTLDAEGRELIDFGQTPAWALVDHQFSHVFVRDSSDESIAAVHRAFESVQGIDAVVSGSERAKWDLDHERAGDVILVSSANSWQAYYWWLEDQMAPAFARTVDIHRKPGYDPVELFFDPASKSIPLDATLVKGSHGVVNEATRSEAVLVTWGFENPIPSVVDDTDLAQLTINELLSKD